MRRLSVAQMKGDDERPSVFLIQNVSLECLYQRLISVMSAVKKLCPLLRFRGGMSGF
jgi:hypothetical protein